MLHHAKPSHRELRLKLKKRAAVTLKEPVEQEPTAGVGKGTKDAFIFHVPDDT